METSMLKLVIAVRHGLMNTKGNLASLGIEQIKSIAGRLRFIVPKQYKVAVLTSSESPLTQSATIIANVFGLETQIVCETLRSDSDLPEVGEMQMSAIMYSIKNACGSDFNTIIAVAHLNSPWNIINAFARVRFRKEVKSFCSNNGNGCMINLETGEVSINLLS
jgi:hypothetical protein